MDFNISNRFGKRISRETKDQIGCFKQYFHGDLGCCEEKRSAVNDTIKQTKKTPPPELSADELKMIKFEYEELPSSLDMKEVGVYQAIKEAMEPNDFEEALATFSLVKRAIRGYRTHSNEAVIKIVKRVIDWRHAVAAKDFVNKPLEPHINTLMSKHWPTLYCGSDKYGHPVLMERISKMDVEAILNTPEADVLRMRTLLMEAVSFICKNNSEGRNYESSQMIWVYDLQGLSSSHVSRKFQQLMSAMGKDCDSLFFYTVFKIYIVNTPFVFRMAWSFITKLMSEVTQAKVSVLGGVDEAAEKLKADLGMLDTSWAKVEPPLAMDQVPAWRIEVKAKLSGVSQSNPRRPSHILRKCRLEGELTNYEPHSLSKTSSKCSTSISDHVQAVVVKLWKATNDPDEMASFPLYLHAVVIAMVAIVTALLAHLERSLFTSAQ